MADKIPITPDGYAKLRDRLQNLRNIERPRVVQMIAEAREHGDLKENAEYHAAKERQGFIESEIKDLEAKIAYAEVIDPKKLTGDRVTFGATVKLATSSGDPITYRIVGADESDIDSGSISIASPLARQLLGKEEGDEIRLRLKGGERVYEILSIEFK